MTALTFPAFAAVVQPRTVLTVAVALAIAALSSLPQDLSSQGKIVLAVSGLTILGWTCTRIPESLVALIAVLALVLTGTLSEAQLFSALGSELIWLLLSAFVIAAVASESGLTNRLVAPLIKGGVRVLPLFAGLTLAIVATAFVLPSTSGRAALLLPVFAALASGLRDPRLTRALALLFPTVILLSAGASLIGAGAHMLAAQAIGQATGLQLGYLDWAMLGLPFSGVASFAGAALILWLFVPRAQWMAPLPPITLPAAAPEARLRQNRIALVLLGVVGLWLTADLHGIGMAVVALMGALVLLTRPFTAKKPKEIFRAVDTELLLYMAATVLIADVMVATGTDRWLAGLALGALPQSLSGSLPVVVTLMAVIAVTAHLAITSRSARAAVLIPAVALPLAAMGHDPALMILIAVMGTGFCQTLMASAKPVAIFGNSEHAGFTQGDLARLALPLAPVVTGLLIGFALWVWPPQLAAMQGKTAPQSQPQISMQLPELAMLPAPVMPAPTLTSERPLPRPAGLVEATPKPTRAARQRSATGLRQLNRILRHSGIIITVR